MLYMAIIIENSRSPSVNESHFFLLLVAIENFYCIYVMYLSQ